ncbi:hypothetical protein NKH18_48770 [Streptomyces sp. M10(2022)]
MAEPGDRVGVAGGNVVGESFGAAGGAQAGRLEAVLDREGRPSRRPVLSLRARRSSAACAAARAALSSRVTTALIWLASIWARWRSSSSRLEISLRSRA